ncbi:MAG: hypothetical protein OEY29_11155 [Gammaproteobacteria bacterium]|nr:hypothetical protein [Gammaproteobacteria bacterium]
MKFILSLLLFITSAQCNAFEELQSILKHKTAPEGIVIEITSGDKLYLKKIMPELQADIKALRARFEKLPVAIVSHAKESLLLSTKNSLKHPELHQQIKSLSQDDDTAIHVCGTYASWFNIAAEDFPEYINVSPAGPVQVNDYIELGYLHVEL